MKRLYKQLLAVLLVSVNLYSHEFIVKPVHTDGDVNKPIPYSVMVAHRFMMSEEIEDSSYVEISLIEKGNRANGSELTANKSLLTLDGSVTPTKKGGAQIIAHRKAMPWSKTTKGWVVGNKETLKGVIESNLYEKFCKVQLVVDGDDTGYDRVVGDRLEIVPVSSPEKARIGDEIKFRILFNGKPLASTVQAGFDGFSKGANTYAFSGDTDENGVITIPFHHAGLWMVRVDHTVPAEDQKLYKKHNTRAIYMFEIR